ncbi:MAG: DUF192 domain-containing protein [bacterium]|nr:MAG: DUF192 domain-containing protein [bacterium]
MKLMNIRTGEIAVTSLTIRSTFWGRFRGYLLLRRPDRACGLLLLGAARVHTLLMAFPIDIYYLDRSLIVLDCMYQIAPNRILPRPPWGTAHVLETPHGSCGPGGSIRAGDRLVIRTD